MTIPDHAQLAQDPISHFAHIRILIGMIVGLGLTHLLRNFAEIIEQPGQRRVYWIHLAWALFVFLYMLHFWWWEFRLTHVTPWSFNLYLFISLYALLLYLLCAFTFPSSADRHLDHREYFYSRRSWFFGALGLIYAVDMWDTWIKGPDYFYGLGTEYVVRNVSHAALCLIAMFVRSSVFHGAFALSALAYQISWIARQFEFV